MQDFREFQEDFETDTHSVEGASTVRRPDAVSLDYLVSHTLGGTAFADPSLGVLHRVWQCQAINDPEGGGLIRIRPSAVPVPQMGEWGEWQTLWTFSGDPVTEIDACAQQNADFVVCAERAGVLWILYFDPFTAARAFLSFGPGRTPRVILDDPEDTDESDVLVFYIDSGGVKYRQQNELYAIAHEVPAEGWLRLGGGIETLDTENAFLEDVAITRDKRVMVIASQRDEASGTYAMFVRESAPYPARVFDSLTESRRVLSFDPEQVSISYTDGLESLADTRRITEFFAEALVLDLEPPSEDLDTPRRLLEMFSEPLIIVYSTEENITTPRRITAIFDVLFQLGHNHQTPANLTTPRRILSFNKVPV